MNTTIRKTKPQRALEAIGDVARKIDYFHDYELLKIGQAAFPDLKEFSPRLVVCDDMIWRKEDLEGHLYVLASDSAYYTWRMARVLVFFRELYRDESTDAIRHDIRLVYEFDVPIVGGARFTVRLDCETGHLWRPISVAQMRAKWSSPEKCKEVDRFETAANAKCAAALREILTKVEYSTFWQIGGTDFAAERVTEVLESRRRQGRAHNTEFVEILCTKYFPAGSALPTKDEQEEFRQNFLARLEAA